MGKIEMSIPFIERNFSKSIMTKQNFLLTHSSFVKRKLKTSDKNILQMNQPLITI